MVNQARKLEFEAALGLYPLNNLQILLSATQAGVQTDPTAWLALEACDAALVASGTATLETALFKRPMVISYAVSPMIRRVMGWKSGLDRPYLPWVGLPNILLNDFVVPELIQEDATPEKLASAMWGLIDNTSLCEKIQNRFTEMHHTLKCDTPSRVAFALEQIVHDGR
jgi:lipid-A-disaccharide synthase